MPIILNFTCIINSSMKFKICIILNSHIINMFKLRLLYLTQLFVHESDGINYSDFTFSQWSLAHNTCKCYGTSMLR